MKADERELLAWMQARCRLARATVEARVSAREIINSPTFKAARLHPKRAWYLLGKWSGRGWYDYSVSLETGWMTAAGLEVNVLLPAVVLFCRCETCGHLAWRDGTHRRCADRVRSEFGRVMPLGCNGHMVRLGRSSEEEEKARTEASFLLARKMLDVEQSDDLEREEQEEAMLALYSVRWYLVNTRLYDFNLPTYFDPEPPRVVAAK